MLQRRHLDPNPYSQFQTSGSESSNAGPLSVVIVGSSMNLDQQKQAVEIANEALDRCGTESEIASFIKSRMEELAGGGTWHVIVGRNFGSHVSWEHYIQFKATKITILVFRCG